MTPHRSNENMCFQVAKTGFYVQELYRVGIWPINKTNTRLSIQEILNRLEGFQDYYYVTDSRYTRSCDTAKVNFKQRLEDARGRMILGSGLCLNCVKKGKIMSADGNCRAASLELCKNLF